METLIPIIANILAPAILDFLFGSDDNEGQGYKKGGKEIILRGDLSKIGYPTLEKSLEYLFANNFPDVYKLILEKREQFNNSNKMIHGYGTRRKKSGVGYRYPSLEGQPREVAYEYETKKGKRKRTFPVPTDEYMTVYMLNKKRAASNPWIEFMQREMPRLKLQYQKYRLEKEAELKRKKDLEEQERFLEEETKRAQEELEEISKQIRKSGRRKGSKKSKTGEGLSSRRKEFIEKYIPEELKNMTYEELKNRYRERYKRK
jgi:hypothetical protein